MLVRDRPVGLLNAASVGSWADVSDQLSSMPPNELNALLVAKLGKARVPKTKKAMVAKAMEILRARLGM